MTQTPFNDENNVRDILRQLGDETPPDDAIARIEARLLAGAAAAGLLATAGTAHAATANAATAHAATAHAGATGVAHAAATSVAPAAQTAAASTAVASATSQAATAATIVGKGIAGLAAAKIGIAAPLLISAGILGTGAVTWYSNHNARLQTATPDEASAASHTAAGLRPTRTQPNIAANVASSATSSTPATPSEATHALPHPADVNRQTVAASAQGTPSPAAPIVHDEDLHDESSELSAVVDHGNMQAAPTERSELLAILPLIRSGQSRAALQRLSTHEQSYPNGVFAEERLALQIRAHTQLGELTAARSLAQQLLERYPNSIHAEAARALVDSSTESSEHVH